MQLADLTSIARVAAGGVRLPGRSCRQILPCGDCNARLQCGRAEGRIHVDRNSGRFRRASRRAELRDAGLPTLRAAHAHAGLHAELHRPESAQRHRGSDHRRVQADRHRVRFPERPPLRDLLCADGHPDRDARGQVQPHFRPGALHRDLVGDGRAMRFRKLIPVPAVRAHRRRDRRGGRHAALELRHRRLLQAAQPGARAGHLRHGRDRRVGAVELFRGTHRK